MIGEPHKVVLIEWEDATFEYRPRNDGGTETIRTVGWIVREDDNVVVLASEYGQGASIYRQQLTIPKSLIRQRIQMRRK